MKTLDDEQGANLDLSSGSNKNYRKELEEIVEEWNNYRRALRGEERDTFDKLIKQAKIHQTGPLQAHGNHLPLDNPRAADVDNETE